MKATESKTGLIRRFRERNETVDALTTELRQSGALTESIAEKLESLKL